MMNNIRIFFAARLAVFIQLIIMAHTDVSSDSIIINESEFINKIPKIELHAHLNGSFNKDTFLALNQLNGGKIDDQFYQILSTDLSDLDACFSKFKYAHELTQTVEAISLATEKVIETFNQDNVIYLELRTTPRSFELMTCTDYLRAVITSIKSCRTKFPNILVKLLPSIDRSKGFAIANENLSLIIELKKEHPNIICGVDFSGSPLHGKFSDFKAILERARSNDLKLALHCGEVENSAEITEILEFGMDRLGHGTYIQGEQYEILKSKRIPVECCLTSNVLTKTVKTYDDHHFRELFNMKHPVVISTDDLGVFNTNLSNELHIAQRTFNLTRSDMFQLMENAISCSFANDVEKTDVFENLKIFKRNISK